jgi:hypothetical protein
MERARPPRPEGKPSNWWAQEKEPWKKRASAAVETTADPQRQAGEKAEATALSVRALTEAAMRGGGY